MTKTPLLNTIDDLRRKFPRSSIDEIIEIAKLKEETEYLSKDNICNSSRDFSIIPKPVREPTSQNTLNIVQPLEVSPNHIERKYSTIEQGKVVRCGIDRKYLPIYMDNAVDLILQERGLQNPLNVKIYITEIGAKIASFNGCETVESHLPPGKLVGERISNLLKNYPKDKRIDAVEREFKSSKYKYYNKKNSPILLISKLGLKQDEETNLNIPININKYSNSLKKEDIKYFKLSYTNRVNWNDPTLKEALDFVKDKVITNKRYPARKLFEEGRYLKNLSERKIRSAGTKLGVYYFQPDGNKGESYWTLTPNDIV